MATISDVEAAIKALIVGALYPNGAPPTPSVLGYPITIYAGWPDPESLDIDLVETSGHPTMAHVSIYPLPAERNTTRFPNDWEETPAPATTYTLTAASQVVTVGGAAPSPYVVQNLAAFVNGKPYVVTATTGQNAAAVAAALFALIHADIGGATILGAAITLPNSARIGALRVGSTGSASREVRRQEKQFQITVWSSNPTSRAAIADAFDPVLADTPRMTLADGTIARLIYHGTREDDFVQKQRIYRRILIYTVEYATILTLTAAQLVEGEVDTFAADGSALSVTYS